MKWMTKKKAKHGEQMLIRAFAFFPVELNNGYTVWLEFYIKVYSFHDKKLDWFREENMQ